MKHGMTLAAIGVIGLGGLSVSAHVNENRQRDAERRQADQRAEDEAAIRGAINGYIDSFYLKQPELLERAVHPNLKKRDVRTTGGTQYLNEMTRSQLMAMAPVANRGQWDASSKKEIEIYSVELGIASARLTVDGWFDLFHLAQINGEWQIVNVLWAPFPPAAEGEG